MNIRELKQAIDKVPDEHATRVKIVVGDCSTERVGAVYDPAQKKLLIFEK